MRIRASTWEFDRVGRHTDFLSRDTGCYWMHLSPSLHVVLLLLSSARIIWDDFLMLNQVCILGTGSILSVTHYVCPAILNLLVFDPFMLLSGIDLWSPLTHCPWEYTAFISNTAGAYLKNPSCVPSQTSFFPAVGLAPYTS